LVQALLDGPAAGVSDGRAFAVEAFVSAAVTLGLAVTRQCVTKPTSVQLS